MADQSARATVAARPQPKGATAGTPPGGRPAAATPTVGKIPLQAALAGSGLGLVCVLTVGLALARNPRDIAALEEDGVVVSVLDGGAPAQPQPSASAQPDAGGSRLSAAELDAARVGGADSLKALAQRFPEEPTVLRALCIALREKQDYAGALRILRQLIEIAPDRRADKELHQVLIDAANASNEVSTEAFDLLKNKMDAAGPDILFEIVLAQSTSRAARDRAGLALVDPAVQKQETKALAIADDLRRSLPCARKALVSRARDDADSRSLVFLRTLTPAKTCAGGNRLTRFLGGGSECTVYACITPPDRVAIAAAVDAIEKRDKH